MELAVSAPAQRLSMIEKMHEFMRNWDGTAQGALEVVAEMRMFSMMLEALQEELPAAEREYTKKETDLLVAIQHQQKLVHYVLKVARNRALDDLKELNQQGKMKEYIYTQKKLRFLDRAL